MSIGGHKNFYFENTSTPNEPPNNNLNLPVYQSRVLIPPDYVTSTIGQQPASPHIFPVVNASGDVNQYYFEESAEDPKQQLSSENNASNISTIERQKTIVKKKKERSQLKFLKLK